MANLIDVTVATLNSSETISKCLNSIHQNIPYRKIVVVDGGSVDDTFEICKSFGAEIISAPSALLGETRFLQALHCGTKWIAYVDSDVYVNKNWWAAISQQINDNVGLINSRCLLKSSFEEYKRFFEYFWRARPVNVSFSNSLTKRELVLKCKQIRRVHAGEDSVFINYVDCLGLKTITVPGNLAYHDRDIYLHHPFAYYRMGISIKTPKAKIPIIFYRKINQWLRYSKNARSFHFGLLKYLIKLCVFQSAGVLCTF